MDWRTSTKSTCKVLRLGLRDYRWTWDYQRQLVEARKRDEIDDHLLLVSHPDVITLGRKTSAQFLRLSESELAAMGVEVLHVGRGGEVTYHGPGQLIAYPILKLREQERDLHVHLRRLEEVGLLICSSLGLSGERVEGRTGVWVSQQKVAAIGVRATSWVTFHGMAINRTPQLTGFDWIVPCGISDAGVGCLETLSGRGISPSELEGLVIEHFATVFERELVEATPLRED